MSGDSDGQILARMGTDALKWAEEFTRIRAEVGHEFDEGGMIGWFASAIEVGRAAGRRETCPHGDWFDWADLRMCRTCGYVPQVEAASND